MRQMGKSAETMNFYTFCTTVYGLNHPSPHNGGFGIVNYNPRCTYCPLVPKQYTFNAIKGSPQSEHGEITTR